MRFFPITDYRFWLYNRIRFQKLPEWYYEYASQEKRLQRAVQLLGKMQEFDETVTSDINDLWTAVATATGGNIGGLIERVNELENDRDDLRSDIAAVEDSITSLEIQMSENHDDVLDEVDALSTDVDSLAAQVNAIQPFDPSDIITQISDVESMASDGIQNAVESIASNTSAINDLIEELDKLNDSAGPGGISDIIDTLNSINSDVASLFGEVNDADDRIWSLEFDLDSISSRIDDIIAEFGTEGLHAWVQRVDSSIQDFTQFIEDVDQENQDTSDALQSVNDQLTALKDEYRAFVNATNTSLENIEDELFDVSIDVNDLYENKADQSALVAVRDRVSAIEAQLDGVEGVDLTPVYAAIDEANDRIDNLFDSVDSDFSNIETSITAVESSVEGVQSAVTDIQNSLLGFDPSQVSARIQSIESGLENLEEDVGSQFTSLNSEIEALQIKIDNIEIGGGGDIDLTPVLTRLTDVENDLFEVEIRVTTLEEQPGGGYDDTEIRTLLTSVETEIDSLKSTLNTIEEDMGTLGNRVSALEDAPGGGGDGYDDSELRGRVDTVEGTVVQHGDDINSLNARVDSLETDVSELQGQVQDIEQLIGDGSGVDLSELIDRIAILEDSVLALQDEVGDIDITDITDSITALQDRVQALEDAPGGDGGDFDPTEILDELASIKSRLNELERFDSSLRTISTRNTSGSGWVLFRNVGGTSGGRSFYITEGAAYSITRYGMPPINNATDGYVMVADSSKEMLASYSDLQSTAISGPNSEMYGSQPRNYSDAGADREPGGGSNYGDYKLIPKSEFLLDGLKQLPGYSDDPTLSLRPDGSGGFVWS